MPVAPVTGAVAKIVVAFDTENEVAFTPLKVTAVTPTKLVPVIVI